MKKKSGIAYEEASKSLNGSVISGDGGFPFLNLESTTLRVPLEGTIPVELIKVNRLARVSANYSSKVKIMLAAELSFWSPDSLQRWDVFRLDENIGVQQRRRLETRKCGEVGQEFRWYI